ncbi:MAG: DUF4469 domain-containing protein [Treponema sp.]|nr:DUF4469 domain-containing protein [Treponema sp.]
MEEIKTTFNGKDGNGGIVLYANPFGTGKKFYGRFVRDVLSMENIVSRVQQKNPGTDEIIINTGLSYVKREILNALKEGKAVNLLDLGELYIGATGSTASDADSDISDLHLEAKFTTSQLLKDAVANVTIGNVMISNTAPGITKIIDWFTGKEGFTLTAGKNVVLKGKRLKLGAIDSGLYLAPVDENDQVIDDESLWIDCTELVRENSPKTIDFYLPATASVGNTYRIVIKSTYLNGARNRKEPIYTYSDPVTIVTA